MTVIPISTSDVSVIFTLPRVEAGVYDVGARADPIENIEYEIE